MIKIRRIALMLAVLVLFLITSNIHATEDLFSLHQELQTHNAYDWEGFTIDGETYLAVANSHDDFTHNIDSKIYRWDSNSISFMEIQAIPTHGAQGWESFSIDGDIYLAVANGVVGFDSKIYRWDVSVSSFVEVQSISAQGPVQFESWKIDEETYLAVSNHYDGSSYDIDSKI